jgi:GTPase involved in cell partitioning and DNA repair
VDGWLDGWVLLWSGFPSVGKSTLLTQLTGTKSEAAAYEFTTLTCIPGVIHYNDAKIQLLDLPGIIEGAAAGKGRGRQVIACAKSSDLVLMVLDASKRFAAPSSPSLQSRNVSARVFATEVSTEPHCVQHRPRSYPDTRAGGGGHPVEPAAARCVPES